jgi:hypothetical protein
MRLTSRVVTLLAALAVVISSQAAQEKEKDKSDKDKPKSEKKENLARLPNITGKLANPGSDKGKMVLSLPYATPQLSGTRVHIREGHKEVDLTPDDDMVVRKADPPIFYENGKPRRPTSKELKEAKGDPNLPGYQADLSDLKRGQIVTCYYAVKKPGKKGDPDAKKDDGTPRVRMVVIVKE